MALSVSGICQRAAFDHVEIIELHHNQKRMRPEGTCNSNYVISWAEIGVLIISYVVRR